MRATIERINSDDIALVDADRSSLLYWSGLIDDPKTQAVLADLTERRTALARNEAALESLVQEIDGAASAQARVRDNLAAVPADSTLAQRYIAMLEEQEDRIADLETRRQQADKAVQAERAAFAQLVQSL